MVIHKGVFPGEKNNVWKRLSFLPILYTSVHTSKSWFHLFLNFWDTKFDILYCQGECIEMRQWREKNYRLLKIPWFTVRMTFITSEVLIKGNYSKNTMKEVQEKMKKKYRKWWKSQCFSVSSQFFFTLSWD